MLPEVPVTVSVYAPERVPPVQGKGELVLSPQPTNVVRATVNGSSKTSGNLLPLRLNPKTASDSTNAMGCSGHLRPPPGSLASATEHACVAMVSEIDPVDEGINIPCG